MFEFQGYLPVFVVHVRSFLLKFGHRPYSCTMCRPSKNGTSIVTMFVLKDRKKWFFGSGMRTMMHPLLWWVPVPNRKECEDWRTGILVFEKSLVCL